MGEYWFIYLDTAPVIERIKMKLELRFKILCSRCHKEMEDIEEQQGTHHVRCTNPDCKNPSQVWIVEG